MKKLLSVLMASALCCPIVSVNAQDDGERAPFNVYEGAVYIFNSRNGDWAAGATEGVAYIANARTGETYKYGTSDGSSGYLINSICDDGTVCGTYNDRAMIWTPGEEWRELPLMPEDSGISSCFGGPADGSFIVGNVTKANAMGEDNDGIGMPISEVPVIWYKNSEGFYDVYEELPHTDVDWTGRAPQTMFLKGVSADGSTLIGRLIDYSGVVYTPVVWKKNAENEWEYKTYGDEYNFKKDAKKPEHPRYKPTKPDVMDYLTEEEQNRFTEAMEAYQDSVNNAHWSIPDDQRGPWPNYNPEEHYSDFFDKTTQDGVNRHNSFAEAYNKFIDDDKAYTDSLNTFFVDFYNYIADDMFYMTDVAVSENGKYMATNFINNASGSFYPVMMDLETGETSFLKEGSGFFPMSVLEDKTVFLGQVAMIPPLYRYACVWDIENGMLPFGDWVQSVSETAYQDLIANFELAGENIMLGSAFSADGRGAYLCGFNQYQDLSYKSWTLDLTAYADSKYAVEEAVAENSEIVVYPNPATEYIYVKGAEEAAVMLYDLTGRCVLQSELGAEGVAVDMLPRGMYVVKVTDGDRTLEKKIIVGK